MIRSYFDNFSNSVNSRINTLSSIVLQETHTTSAKRCKRTASSRAKADEEKTAERQLQNYDKQKHYSTSLTDTSLQHNVLKKGKKPQKGHRRYSENNC